MPEFIAKTEMPVSAADLYRWHMQPGAFEKLSPPWQKVRVLKAPAVLQEGAVLVMKIYIGPIGVRWQALHRDFIADRQFVDEQLRGPFSSWVHTHRFEPRGEERSLLVDHIEYRLPFGPLGALVGGRFSQYLLKRLFTYRHELIFRELSERQFVAGLNQLSAGKYWESHEHWEAIWRSLPPSAARAAMQSLIQFAAACHKITQATREGRDAKAMQQGMAKLLASGQKHLQTSQQLGPPEPDFSTDRLRKAYGTLTEIHRQWVAGLPPGVVFDRIRHQAAALGRDLMPSPA